MQKGQFVLLSDLYIGCVCFYSCCWNIIQNGLAINIGLSEAQNPTEKFVYVRLLFLLSFHQLHYCKTTPQIHQLYISELNILHINVYEQMEFFLKRKNEGENVTLSESTPIHYVLLYNLIFSHLSHFSVLLQLNSTKYFFKRCSLCFVLCSQLFLCITYEAL